MEGLRVSELADMAGVAPSTVRFYERVGLLSQARRADNGYRLFDASALDELAFISRAKGIGMSLDDIAELVAAWPNTECRLLQARLRAFLAARIDQVCGQRAELEAFETQLRVVLGRLADRHPGPELCGNGCGCEEDLDGTAPSSDADVAAWTCSLDDQARSDRIAEWRALADMAVSVEQGDGAVHMVLSPDADQLATAARLCAVETACCTNASFHIEIGAARVILTARAPRPSWLLESLFRADPPPADDIVAGGQALASRAD